MFYDNTMSVQLSFSQNQNYIALDEQSMVKVRLSRSSDLLCGDTQRLIQRSPPTLFTDSILPFDRHEPLLFKSLLVRFLSPFNLAAFSNTIFNRLFTENLDFNFLVIVDVNVVSLLWIEDYPTDDPMLDLDVDHSPSTNNNGASISAIEKLMSSKFDGELDETEQMCTVCSDELIDDADRKELSRIPCGHVFHQPCIVRWLTMNNSCPLCRAKLQD